MVAGLVFGAGLPAIYALGIRALAYGDGGDAEVSHARPHPVGRLLAYLCFAVVIAGVVKLRDGAPVRVANAPATQAPVGKAEAAPPPKGNS